jgi:mannose-6-phosphate isomerase-like protein (cupin superfamily)
MAHIVSLSELPRNGNTYTFEGCRHGDVGLSFLLDETPPGRGPRLHRHPYEEVFVIQEGRAVFTAGDETLEVSGGQIVIVPPDTPHKFVNAGQSPLRLIAIRPSGRMITEWLEE